MVEDAVVAVPLVCQVNALALADRGEGIMADQDDAVPHLGDLEQAIMEVLWKRQPATVREVVSALPRTPPLAYTTVATIMGRLVDKGLLARSRAGKVDLYCPAYDSAEFSRRVAAATVQQLVHDYGEVALAQFAAALERADPERIARLRERYQPGQSAAQEAKRVEKEEGEKEKDRDVDA
jgi:predicted transcriptional regulator